MISKICWKRNHSVPQAYVLQAKEQRNKRTNGKKNKTRKLIQLTFLTLYMYIETPISKIVLRGFSNYSDISACPCLSVNASVYTEQSALVTKMPLLSVMFSAD